MSDFSDLHCMTFLRSDQIPAPRHGLDAGASPRNFSTLLRDRGERPLGEFSMEGVGQAL
jgi:hypothetical protein